VGRVAHAGPVGHGIFISSPSSASALEVEAALMLHPDLTLAQIKRWLVQMYGLRLSEVGKVFRGLGRVYEHARKEALEIRQARQEWANQP
jgi:hypothetical protein